MTLEEALILSKRFPKDRTVPKKIAAAIRNSRGEKKDNLMQIGEGIIMQCETQADKALVIKYLMN